MGGCGRKAGLFVVIFVRENYTFCSGNFLS